MKRRAFLKAFACAGALASTPFFTTCRGSNKPGMWVERVVPLMGSFVSVAVWIDSRANGLSILEDTFSFMRKKIDLISNWDSTSEVSLLNERRKITSASDEVKALIRYSNYAALITGGTYNPLSYPLTLLWRTAKEENSIPGSSDIKDALRRSSGLLDVRGDSILLHGEGSLDVNGIGQGFIADLAAHYLAVRGISKARIDCSGDLKLLGADEWRIEVEDPRSENMLGTLHINGEWGVGSSGDYENCWFVNGRRYHHLIDPHSGYPGESAQHVVIFHRSAAIADALATGIFFGSVESSLKLLGGLPGVEGFLVDRDHRVFMTPGLNSCWIPGNIVA